MRGDDPREAGATRVFSASPIMVGEAYEGYLYVILGGQEYENAFQLVAGNYVLRMGLWATVGALLFALVVFGQMTMSAGLDHFGAINLPQQSFTLAKGLGVLLIIGGVVLVQR